MSMLVNAKAIYFNKKSSFGEQQTNPKTLFMP
jgi:hypothetical protein